MEKNLAVALLLLLVLLLDSGDANSGALIKSKSGQPLTSSTLIWMSPSALSGTPASTQLLEDAVSSGSPGGGYVCRFQHAGRLHIGSTILPTEPDPSTDQDIQSDLASHGVGSGCRIVYYGRIINRADRYEVLVNLHGAGRIVWTSWDKFVTSFTGAVQVGDHYVARVLVHPPDGQQSDFHRLGHLDPTLQRGRIFTVDDKEAVVESTQGEVLVEIEPVEYELGPPQSHRHRRKVQSQEEVILAHTILDNETGDLSGVDGEQLLEGHQHMEHHHHHGDEEQQIVASSLTYVINHSVYFGQVKGMVKGLPSSVHLGGGLIIGMDNGTELGSATSGGWIPFRWGDSSTILASFTQVLDVAQSLDRGAAVNVTLTARRITFDGPYSAALTTSYADGSVKKRQIDGHARQTILEEFKLSYSPAYYLSDGSPVPERTTTITPSTTSSTSTTTPLPSTTSGLTSAGHQTKSQNPSNKQTKETLELKSRNSSNSNFSNHLCSALSAIIICYYVIVR